METNRILILLSPIVMLPMAVLAIGLGMSSILTVFILAIYTIILIKALAQ